MSALVYAAREMAQESDPAAALGILVDTLRGDLGIHRAGIFLYEPHTQVFDRIYGISRSGEPESTSQRIPVRDVGTPMMDVALRRRAYIITDDAPGEYPQMAFEPGIRSLAVVPIIVGEELLGLLCADNYPSGEPFRAEAREPLFLYAGLAALPLFALYQAREKQRAELTRRRIHREVLHAVTGGKMVLCEPEEIAKEWPLGPAEIPIRKELDVRQVRESVRMVAVEAGMSEDRAADLGLCASEAATNALLHGSGGQATVECRGELVRIRIEDRGGGIHPDDLPRATLLKGWSKRASMGLGFTVIKETADRVFLSTGAEGTTIIIEMAVAPDSTEPDCFACVQWESVTS